MTRQEAASLVLLAVSNMPNMQEKDMNPTITLWATMLYDTPYEIAEKAIRKILMTSCKFWPAVSEIIDTIKGFGEDKLPSPEEAWLEVVKKVNRYKTPEWSCPEIGQAVTAIGYLNICDSETPGVERAHFMRIYEAYKHRSEDEIVNLQIEAIGESHKMIEGRG